MPKTEDKLDIIIAHLQNIDKRDRLRMRAGFVKGIIGIVPTLAFIAFAVYFYYHGDEVMEKIARQAAEQAAAVTKMGTSGILEQFKNFQTK